MAQTLPLAILVVGSLGFCLAQPRSLLSSRSDSRCAQKVADVAPSDVLNLEGWGIAMPLSCDCELSGKRCEFDNVIGYQNKYFYADQKKKV